MSTLKRAMILIPALALWQLGSAAVRPKQARLAQTGESVNSDQAEQVQSVSGRITAVTGNTFSLEPTQSNDGPNKRSAITVVIDQDTVVEGRIQVGAKADVTFRREAGNNVAVSVRISRA